MTYTKTETAILYHYLQDEIIDTTLVTPSLSFAMNRSYNKVVLVEELNKGIVRRIEQYGDEWLTTELNAKCPTQEDDEDNPLSIGNRIE